MSDQKNQAKPPGNGATPRPKLPIGLALSSGVARGIAHIGVMKALKRHGIEPTVISGTSMGALVGGAYLIGRMDAVEEWARDLNRLKVVSYLDFRVRSSGLIGGKRLVALMRENFGNIRLEDMPHPFIAIATDLATGHEVWLRKGDLVDVIRASFSLPGIFPPVNMNNRWLLDGALVNPTPVSPLLAHGSRLTIAVNAGGDMIGKAVRKGQTIPTIAGFDLLNDSEIEGEQTKKARSIAIARRIFRREQNSPSIMGVMFGSLNIVQDRLSRSRLAGDPPDVLIQPRVGHIGLMEFDRASELIEEGEAAVERALPDIMAAIDVIFGSGHEYDLPDC